ncbi:MAG: hypothetical protein FWF53_08730 [Candidatus Azobacteroides sp.]|nr:hypothetical protein [Candidatus Azobacteroides sp.]
MKRIHFLVFFMGVIFNIGAQSSTYYNYQGDQAFQKRDYQAARSWYSEGLDSCDRYSIQKLVEIWVSRPAMRESMRLPMQKCYNCMKTIVEAKEPEMMRLYSDFYKFGIGTSKDSVLYNYWYMEWWNSFKTTLDITPGDLNLPVDSSAIKTPRKSLLSNRFCSFLTYTYSTTMPFGLTAGIYFDRIGGYVSLRTDFKSMNAAYECDNTKVPAIDIENPPYEFNRERWCSQMITGGLLYPVIRNRLFASVGGGYGKRDYYREIRSTTNQNFSTGNRSEWCFNTEASYKGLALEAGGMFVWKKLTVTAGVNSIKFKDLDVYIGLGVTF